MLSCAKRTILDAIEDLLIKERLNLAPRLRELDTQIEDTELRLREVVRDGLEDDVSKCRPTYAKGHCAARSRHAQERGARRRRLRDPDHAA